MSIIVFLEKEDQKLRKISLEAVAFANGLADMYDRKLTVIGVTFGNLESNELKKPFQFGCDKVIHVVDKQFDNINIQLYAHVLNELMNRESSSFFLVAQSSFADPVAARISVKQNAGIATNVTELPESIDEFIVRRSIHSGKAFEKIILATDKKVLSIRKNAVELKENARTPDIEVLERVFDERFVDAAFTGKEKASGDILLPEADIIVSAGRGLKGPENWTMVESLAHELGAALACSKPVSDAGWRPHHEHVGQTGIKVAPNLYIAIGISGAIQHLAGVSASKVIVVINNDPEAPFFKNADYGVIGDAFKIVPKLIDIIRNNK